VKKKDSLVENKVVQSKKVKQMKKGWPQEKKRMDKNKKKKKRIFCMFFVVYFLVN
jgi:hypothetical protein